MNLSFRFQAVALVCLAPLSANAQAIEFSITPTEQCVTSDRGMECIGLAANACMEANEAGYSTNGMSICTEQELDWWDDRLNGTYQFLLGYLAEIDAESPAYAPSQVDTMKDMQRAWIPFRDAKCEFVAAGWTGGTGAVPATIWCLMEETAQQTLYLEQRFQN